MKREILTATLVASIACAPATAQDISPCVGLQSEQANVMADITRLLVKYPGTNIVIGICRKIAENKYKATGNTASAVGAFSACAFLGCALAGFHNCIDVAKRWILLTLRVQEIQKQRHEHRCG